MAATYPSLLAAGITDEGENLPFELYAGEAEIVTSQFTSAEDIDQFEIVVCSSAGLISVWNGTDFPSGGAATLVPLPMGIAAQAIANGEMGPVFVGGSFNHEVLAWPGGVSTLAARKAAFVGTNIVIAKNLGGSSGATMTLP